MVSSVWQQAELGQHPGLFRIRVKSSNLSGSPAGKAMFQMCGVFAEFERAMIRERVKAALERARAKGKTLGRPRTPKVVENQIRAARRKGKGIKKIARELGVGVSTVQRVVHESTPQTGHLG